MSSDRDSMPLGGSPPTKCGDPPDPPGHHDAGETHGRTLAKKIDLLFHTMHPRDRGEYSLEEVAEGIRRRGGPTISATYIWQLRKGLKDNPTKKHLEALADFFGVSPLYFFDHQAAACIEEQLNLLQSLRDEGIRIMALRAVGLSPQSLQAITGMIERVRQLEGVADAPDGVGRSRRGRPSRSPEDSA